ncbi:hypothetical protein F8M41_016302 [Gigaspora margarita]|uniref:SAM domain-containing protein n=1 Tax=Gigaspora margarita TaxID=4874 RepID=A0A8H4B377_GIGMA|nr:hypothetical protein F8M41_016302 [Gigaspora margarita]
MNDEEFTDTNIDESFFNKLQEEEITDNSFIRLHKDDLKECGLNIGPIAQWKFKKTTIQRDLTIKIML